MGTLASLGSRARGDERRVRGEKRETIATPGAPWVYMREEEMGGGGVGIGGMVAAVCLGDQVLSGPGHRAAVACKLSGAGGV